MAKQKGKPEKVYSGTGVYIGLVAVLITLTALVILAAQNTEAVQFSFLTWDLKYPLVAIILATIGSTIILDEATGFIWRGRRRRMMADRMELKKLRAEAASAPAILTPTQAVEEVAVEVEVGKT